MGRSNDRSLAMAAVALTRYSLADTISDTKSERTTGQKGNQNISLTPHHNAKNNTKPITTAPDSTAITTR
jgi:hypothetical protein